jgi:hypothetical protein
MPLKSCSFRNIKNTSANKDNILTAIILIVTIASYARFQLSLNYFGQSIIFTLAALVAIAFFIKRLRTAKILLGVLIVFGCIPFGFTIFNLFMDFSHEANRSANVALEQNNDAILFGPLPALVFLLIAVIYFFDGLKVKKDIRMEKYFSYAIFFTSGITFLISAYFGIHL